MRIAVYCSGADPLKTAKRHFHNAENKMLDAFPGLEKNYEYYFRGWKLYLRSKNKPGPSCTIDLELCCMWKFDPDLGLTFRYGDRRCVLYFDQTLFGPAKLEFYGFNELHFH